MVHVVWEALRHGLGAAKLQVFAHVINIHEHGENVLVRARLCGNHQVDICELATVVMHCIRSFCFRWRLW